MLNFLRAEPYRELPMDAKGPYHAIPAVQPANAGPQQSSHVQSDPEIVIESATKLGAAIRAARKACGDARDALHALRPGHA